MKRNTGVIGISISKEELNELVRETKETIALNGYLQSRNSFAAVDLWNVQKKNRSALDRRRRLN